MAQPLFHLFRNLHGAATASLASLAARGRSGWVSRLGRREPQVGASTEPAAVLDAPPCLPALASSLAELARRTDPDFARLGTDLKSLHAAAFELSRSIGQYAGSVRDTLQGSRLNGADGTAARCLAGLQAGMDAADGNLAALQEVAGALGQLHAQGAQIERIAMILKSSGCTFAVESARSAECQQAFGSFVEELRSLAEKIASLGSAIGGQSRETQASLEGLTRVINGDLEQLRNLTRRSEASVRQTAEQMQRLLDSSCSALQQAEARAREITRHADDVVFHLQFGDNVRQRLEHVVAALEDASAASNSPEKTALILDIQLAQLAAIGGEVEDTQRQLLEAFGGLARESASLGEGVRDLGGGESANDGGQDLFEQLKSELVQLEGLQRQGHTLCARANETSQQAIASAASLSQHLDKVQDINREMHLQALNAIIKTALLGEAGRTLEVLSTHVHTVFQESSGLVEQTIRVLEQVRSSAHRTGDAGSALADEDTDLQGGLAQIAKVHGEFSGIAETALQLVGRQNARLEEVRSRLEFLGALSGRLAAFAEEVRAVRRVLPEVKPGNVPDDELVSLSRRYTMESERAVHRRITGTANNTPENMGRSLQPVATGDDNLDFFDAPVAPAAAAVAQASDKKPEKAQDFGDNIDLF